jgi:hypothetical protein
MRDATTSHLRLAPVVTPLFHVEDGWVVLGDVELAHAAYPLVPGHVGARLRFRHKQIPRERCRRCRRLPPVPRNFSDRSPRLPFIW